MTSLSHAVCRRCGRCCEKGGPALHRRDRDLVESGILPLRTLFTIRRGERVRDNVRGTLEPAEEEMVKIRGQGREWCCFFYDADLRGCTVYEHRPLECRVLQCTDPRELTAVYRTERLHRRDLLQAHPPLLELVEDHDRRCDYRRLAKLRARLAETGVRGREASKILDMVNYDHHLRRVLAENGGVDPEQLDFLLGRPMRETLPGFGIRVRKGEGGKVALELESEFRI